MVIEMHYTDLRVWSPNDNQTHGDAVPISDDQARELRDTGTMYGVYLAPYGNDLELYGDDAEYYGCAILAAGVCFNGLPDDPAADE